MGNLSDLPNELIVEVWRHVLDPEAVESFAVTSKIIYELGSAFIKEHYELKAKFSYLDHCQYDVDDNRPADTLECLLLNSRTALYVRDISIDAWRDGWDPDDPTSSTRFRHSPYSEESMELFRGALRCSPFVPQHEVEHWIKELESGDEDGIHALIIMQLPNLQAFRLENLGPSQLRLSRTIQRIANADHTSALSRLAEVYLQPSDCSVSGDVDWIHTFSAVPSVKIFKKCSVGNDLDCGERNCCPDWRAFDKEGYDYQCRHIGFNLPPKSSSVVDLSFDNCFINPTRLFGLVEGMRGLQKFAVNSSRTSPQVKSPRYRIIVAALLAHAKNTLEKLLIRSSSEFIRCAVTLAEFEVLKELEIEYDLLLDHEDVPKLADVLPPSIEKVHLRRLCPVINPHLSVANDVIHMAAHKAERLPSLKELRLLLYQSDEALEPETLEKMKQKCADARVTLTVG